MAKKLFGFFNWRELVGIKREAVRRKIGDLEIFFRMFKMFVAVKTGAEHHNLVLAGGERVGKVINKDGGAVGHWGVSVGANRNSHGFYYNIIIALEANTAVDTAG